MDVRGLRVASGQTFGWTGASGYDLIVARTLDTPLNVFADLRPELDDDFTYGFRYAFNLTPNLALEAAVGETLTSVTKLAGGDTDLDLSTLDLDAVWHFNPGDRVVAYALGGVGYARANLDDPITGLVNGQPVSIDDDQGFTLNAGAGAKFYVNDRFLVRLEARYRYLDSVLDSHDDSLNTVETTLGVAWQF